MIRTDPDRLNKVNPREPGILGTLPDGSSLIVDGNHRARRAVLDRIPFMVRVLNEAETHSICLDKDALRRIANAAPLSALPEFCYALKDAVMYDRTLSEVRPIIIVRGEMGYNETDWHWKKQHAREALNMKNALLGVSPVVADRMMSCSMFGWPTE